jgi:hypothetical protein
MKEKADINTGTDMSSLVSDSGEKDVIRKSQAREDAINQKIEGKIKNIESLKVPEMPRMPDAPKQQDYNTYPMKTFGSGAMWLATFGSLLTRHPLTTALNSAAEVNKAVATGDANAYKNAMDKWKTQSDYAMKMANFDMERYKESLSQGEAGIRAYSGMMKNDTARLAMEMKQNDQHLKDSERQLKMMEEGIKLQNLQFQQKYADLTVDAAKKKAIEAGKPLTEEETARIYNETLGQAKGAQAGKVSKTTQAAQMANIDWANMQDSDPVGDSGLTLAAVKQAAETIKNTGDYSKAGLGVGWNPAKMAVDNYMGFAYPGFNRAAAGLDYIAQKKAATVAADNYAKMTIATNNLDNSIPLLEEKIKAVDPSRFKSWNAMENYVNEHAGDPAIVGLKEALTATKSDYQQVIARGGQVTDSVRAEANANLNMAWSEGQYKEALSVMKREGQNQLKSAKDSLKSAKKAGLIEDDQIKKAEATPGEESILPLPVPADKKFIPGKYYDLSAEGHGTHKYLGNGEFE